MPPQNSIPGMDTVPGVIPGVVVLGMHRSGTSALAALLAKMGAYLGEEGDLLPPSDENPKGYFEHRHLVAANQWLLTGDAAPWLQAIDYGSVGFDCGAVPKAVQTRFLAAARALLLRLGSRGAWAIKDPRLSLTFPCWAPLLPGAVCLYMIRDPLAVARSLQRRADMPLHVGVAMWELYNLRILEHTQGLPTLRIRFEDLLHSPMKSAISIRDFLDANGVDGITLPKPESLSDAIDSGLARSYAVQTDLPELLNRAQLALWDRLSGHEHPGFEDVTQGLSAGAQFILGDYEHTRTELSRLATLEHNMDALHDEMERQARSGAARASELEAQLVEQRRGLEDRCRNQLLQQKAALEAAFEVRMSEVTTRHEALVSEARSDVDRLQHLVERLIFAGDAVFNSLTWKAGTLAGAVLPLGKWRGQGTAEHFVKRLEGEFDAWRRDSQLRTTGGGGNLAALAAHWVRIHGSSRLIAAAVIGCEEAREADRPGEVFRRGCLPLTRMKMPLAVLPVVVTDLVRVPADLLLVQTSALSESEDMRRILSRCKATGIPLVCLVDRALSAKGMFEMDDLQFAAPILDRAEIIVALNDAVAESLRAYGSRVRVLPPELPDSEERGASERREPSTEDAVWWQAVVSCLDFGPAGLRRLGTFDWPRLPIIEDTEFDAEAYLSQNPDVVQATDGGVFADAREHWEEHGRWEVRQGARRYVPGLVLLNQGRWRLTEGAAKAMRAEAAVWPQQPLVSLVMPTWNSEPEWLSEAIESVLGQTYPYWELCIADDGSTRKDTLALLDRLGDPRIRVRRLSQNLGIAGASNAALDMAQGDYVALLDHDDLLAPDALFQVAKVIVEQDPDLLYSDEDKVSPTGERDNPYHKPDYSPDLLLSQNYFSHLGVYRRSLLQAVGGFRPGYDGSQDYDLVLRCTARTSRVAHIPHCLYHWRMVPGSTALSSDNKEYAYAAGQRALQGTLKERGLEGTVEMGPFPGTYHVRRRIHGQPLISIVIPFRDQPRLLKTCLESLLRYTAYENFEVIGVSNESKESETYALMEEFSTRDSRIRFVREDIAFNYSRLNNRAVGSAFGTHLLFLNNDIEITDSGWLEALIEHSQRPEVGCVGARLLYPDRTIQHAGVVIGLKTLAGHAHRFLPMDAPGYFAQPWLTHNVAAVTAACMMVRKSVFQEIGGFNEEDLAVAFNDVDLCLRLLEKGYLNVYTPHCTLVHHESKSRGLDDTMEKRMRFANEVRYAQERHAGILVSGDPFYNPHLSMHHEDFRVVTQPQWMGFE